LPIFERQNMMSYQFEAIERTIHQNMRLGRLIANTQFPATCLNGYLTETAPKARVLTGELIVF
jgi:hypothetical protein